MPVLSLLIKPASGNCNMRCTYCFYADELNKREGGSFGMMSRETMHIIVDKALVFGDKSVTFAFQGGEPTLVGLDFFRDFVAYVEESRQRLMQSQQVQAQNDETDQKIVKNTSEKWNRIKSLKIEYAIQTNGYAIDEEWAKFLVEHHFLVGVSLDGTREVHDRYRVDAAGAGTYNRVLANIRLLEKYKVTYNILTVVTAATARNGQKIYNFFKKNKFGYQQYIECLDPIGEIPGGHDYSLTPERYATFLKSIFDSWYLDMKAGTYVYNRYFENLMMLFSRQLPESCSMRGVCGKQWVIEADGSTYPCDFYALDEWKLGNITEDSFEAMDQKRDELGFIAWSEYIPEECRACKWSMLCRNGCRRHCESVTESTRGKNYFCEAYKEFFEYAYPRLAEVYQRYAR